MFPELPVALAGHEVEFGLELEDVPANVHLNSREVSINRPWITLASYHSMLALTPLPTALPPLDNKPHERLPVTNR